ncbi:saccharopine dehydrogenase NADP-binding domain-containing protein [Nocardia sp. NPDC050710]|uniref:saccharopine dehydrogenase family protein n=1 Tax=Nocardia sp. NPDC050710 TaxID=3157220 RepID=UPI0033F759B7
MKVLALGGPGAMGAVAVHTAARLPGVEEIVIADRDLGAAERLARRLAQAPVPVRAIEVDVTDDTELRNALSGADLVLNTVGPYYRFGPTVLRAAIETRTHYLDICDDWEPTLRMLDLDRAARDNDVCAVIGMGASPGVSNLLAATAAAELDTVHNAYTAWPVDVDGTGSGTEDERQLLGPDGRPSAAAVHWMQQASGTITVVRAGRLSDQRPLSPVTLRLPGGRRGTAYSVGHPEPITLQRSLEPVGDAVNLMVIKPWTVAYLDVLRRDIDSGKLTNETAAGALAAPKLSRILRSIPTALCAKGPGTLPPFFAAVSGVKQGREYMVLAQVNRSGPRTDPARSLFDDMARATGIPLALGMSQVIDGSARRPGVHSPEAIIDPRRFFDDLDRALERNTDTPIYVVEREPIA